MISTCFNYLDLFLGVALPIPVRVVVWAALSGLLSMWIYAICSPQQRMRELQQQAADLQQKLSSYDGEFRGAMALVRQNLSLSMRRLGWALGPSLVAGLPVLLVLFWMATNYAVADPEPGQVVAVHVHPAQADVQWEPTEGATPGDQPGTWMIDWPQPGGQLTLGTAEGVELLTVPLVGPQSELTRRTWWSVIFASRAGYLPSAAGVERVELELAPLEIHSYGPAWARSWLTIFLLGTSCAALALKIGCGIQ